MKFSSTGNSIFRKFLDFRAQEGKILVQEMFVNFAKKFPYASITGIGCSTIGFLGSRYIQSESDLYPNHNRLESHHPLYQTVYSALWVSGITSRATESYFANFLSLAVHFNLQNIRYCPHFIHSDLPTWNKFREVCDFSREVIPLTHSEWLIFSEIAL